MTPVVVSTPEGLAGCLPDEYGLIVGGRSGERDTALRAAMERFPARRFGF